MCTYFCKEKGNSANNDNYSSAVANNLLLIIFRAQLGHLNWGCCEFRAGDVPCVALHNSAFSPAPGNDLSKKSVGPMCYRSGASNQLNQAPWVCRFPSPCCSGVVCLVPGLPGTVAAMPEGREMKRFGPGRRVSPGSNCEALGARVPPAARPAPEQFPEREGAEPCRAQLRSVLN